jgi:hypothetical protein
MITFLIHIPGLIPSQLGLGNPVVGGDEDNWDNREVGDRNALHQTARSERRAAARETIQNAGWARRYRPDVSCLTSHRVQPQFEVPGVSGRAWAMPISKSLACTGTPGTADCCSWGGEGVR